MNDTATTSAAAEGMWLPAHALNCYEGDASVRAWLMTQGLLTERVRAQCGAEFFLRVVHEGPAGSGHLRAIELGTRTTPWIYAETQVPAATLARHPWLGEIGGVSLGEKLAGHDGVTRTDYQFARLTPDAPIVARALARIDAAAQPLWVRRFQFFVEGAPLTVQEVFVLGLGRSRAA